MCEVPSPRTLKIPLYVATLFKGTSVQFVTVSVNSYGAVYQKTIENDNRKKLGKHRSVREFTDQFREYLVKL